MNREIIFLSYFLVTLCTIVCICHGVWLRNHDDELDLMQFYRKKEITQNQRSTIINIMVGAWRSSLHSLCLSLSSKL